MRYKVLFADADQTLFDFDAGEKNAIAATFRHFGYPVTPESVQTYHRVNAAQWLRLERGETTQEKLRVDRFADFLRETGLAGDPAALCDEFIQNLSEQSIALPGTEAFCKAVSAVMPIVVVTNGIAVIQRKRYAQSVLRPYFHGMIVSEEQGVTKPDPRMLEAALALAGPCDKRDCVFMGDSVTADIACARNAGVDSILFTNGREPPEGHGATHVARTFADALAVLMAGGLAPCTPDKG